MKKFLFLFALIFLLGLQSHETQDFPAFVNLLKNSGFENGLTKWNKTGSATIALTSQALIGKSALIFNSTAINETLYQTITIPSSLNYQSCSATIYYRYSSGNDGDYRLEILAGSLSQGYVDLLKGDEWKAANIAFICSTSQTYTMRVISTTDGGDLFLDAAYFGINNKLTVRGQDTNVLVRAKTGILPSDTTFFAKDTEQAFAFNTSGSVIYYNNYNVLNISNGVFTAPKQGVYLLSLQYEINGVSTAYYIKEIRLNVYINSALYKKCSGFRHQTDATVWARTYTDNCTINLLLNQNDTVQFKVYVDEHSSNNQWQILPSTIEISLLKSEIELNQVVELAAQEFQIVSRVYTSDTTNLLLSTSDVSFTFPTVNVGQIQNANMVLENIYGNAEITCASGVSSGTTCPTSNEELGIAFNITKTGYYEVCMSGTDFAYVNNTAGYIRVSFHLFESPNDQRVYISGGKNPENHGFESQILANRMPFKVCEVFNFNSIGKKTIRTIYKQQANYVVSNQHFLLASGDSAGIANYIVFTVRPISERTPQAVAINSLDVINMTPKGATDVGRYNYIVGQTYNASTITISGTNYSSTVRGVLTPYLTNDGTYRLKGNATINFSSSTTSGTLSISGITTKNITGYNQPCTIRSTTVTGSCYFSPNSGTLNFTLSAGATSAIFDFDIELETKPAWSY
jgi:hypothetical protein